MLLDIYLDIYSKTHPDLAPDTDSRTAAKTLLNAGTLEAGAAALLIKCLQLRTQDEPHDTVPHFIPTAHHADTCAAR